MAAGAVRDHEALGQGVRVFEPVSTALRVVLRICQAVGLNLLVVGTLVCTQCVFTLTQMDVWVGHAGAEASKYARKGDGTHIAGQPDRRQVVSKGAPLLCREMTWLFGSLDV